MHTRGGAGQELRKYNRVSQFRTHSFTMSEAQGKARWVQHPGIPCYQQLPHQFVKNQSKELRQRALDGDRYKLNAIFCSYFFRFLFMRSEPIINIFLYLFLSAGFWS
jgi:hypothetical protein